MAFGEHRLRYPEVADMLMFKVGTGVGSGIIANGQMHRGADGAAGDIGHNQIPVRRRAPSRRLPVRQHRLRGGLRRGMGARSGPTGREATTSPPSTEACGWSER